MLVYLAVEVDRERMVTFTDGAWFVLLALITTADARSSELATALRLALHSSDPQKTLLQMLLPQQRLLLLDNFEQLLVAGVEGQADAVDLLDAAPEVQIIVTSRERFKLQSEQLYAIPALTFSCLEGHLRP